MKAPRAPEDDAGPRSAIAACAWARACSSVCSRPTCPTSPRRSGRGGSPRRPAHASIHRAPWPDGRGAATVAAPTDAGGFDVAVRVPRRVRRAKSARAATVGRQLARLRVPDDPGTRRPPAPVPRRPRLGRPAPRASSSRRAREWSDGAFEVVGDRPGREAAKPPRGLMAARALAAALAVGAPAARRRVARGDRLDERPAQGPGARRGARSGRPCWPTADGRARPRGPAPGRRRGGLYLSVLAAPAVSRWRPLPLAAGVAVARRRRAGVAGELKWPNDVLGLGPQAGRASWPRPPRGAPGSSGWSRHRRQRGPPDRPRSRPGPPRVGTSLAAGAAPRRPSRWWRRRCWAGSEPCTRPRVHPGARGGGVAEAGRAGGLAGRGAGREGVVQGRLLEVDDDGAPGEIEAAGDAWRPARSRGLRRKGGGAPTRRRPVDVWKHEHGPGARPRARRRPLAVTTRCSRPRTSTACSCNLFRHVAGRAEGIDAAALASVAPPRRRTSSSRCGSTWAEEPLAAGPGSRPAPHPLRAAGRRGSRRIVNGKAPSRRTAGRVVVHFGTATTFDVMTRGGEHGAERSARYPYQRGRALPAGGGLPRAAVGPARGGTSTCRPRCSRPRLVGDAATCEGLIGRIRVEVSEGRCAWW